MSREFRILLEIAGDVVLVLGMVIIASIGAGWCHEALTPALDVYVCWFGLWTMPIYWYGKWRGVWEEAPPGLGQELLLHLAILQTLILCGLGEQPVWLFAIGAILSSLVARSIVSRTYRTRSPPLVDKTDSSES